MTDCVLSVDGREYTGWRRIRIRTSIEQVAGSYELECADRWAIVGQPTPELTGHRCTVLINGQPVISGYVDEDSRSYSRVEHTLTLSGRDATGDLVDCAAITDGQGWAGRTLAQIARDVCKPYGISVSYDDDAGGAFAKAVVNTGETVIETLRRLAALRGKLLVSTGTGGLLITGVGRRRAQSTLMLGVNILQAEITRSVAERFRTYRVIGQANELDYDDSASAQQILATATDPAIRAARVTVIDPSDAVDTASAAKLAQWTAAVNAAHGLRARITVRGWMDLNQVWSVNTLVHMVDRYLGLDGDYLICEAEFGLDDRGGQVTELTITPPAAYTPMPARDDSDDEDDSP